MIKIIKTYYKKSMSKLRIWSIDKMFGLFLFNIIMMLLILLYTAGYFAPFFPLTINFIVFISLVISVLLLGIRSKTLLFVSLLFWVFAAFLRIVKIEVWAERTAVYSYQSLIIGIVILIIEIRFDVKNGKNKNYKGIT